MNWLDKFEHFLIILVSRIAPWAAPLAPAYLVARSIQVHFEAPLWIAQSLSITIVFSSLWLFYFIVKRCLDIYYPIVFPEPDGLVYLLRRSDGIYKIGSTIDLQGRIAAHEQDYGLAFRLVKAWQVYDRYKQEQLALRMTEPFFHNEGNRRELRKMNVVQVIRFIMGFGRKADRRR